MNIVAAAGNKQKVVPGFKTHAFPAYRQKCKNGSCHNAQVHIQVTP